MSHDVRCTGAWDCPSAAHQIGCYSSDGVYRAARIGLGLGVPAIQIMYSDYDDPTFPVLPDAPLA